MSFADNLCKQFGLRLRPTKLFDFLIVKNFLKKLILEKNQQETKKLAKYPTFKELMHNLRLH